MSDIKLERAWAMPNKNTFDIAPIKKGGNLLKRMLRQ